MTEDNDSKIHVRDSRMFNADGTMRDDHAEEPEKSSVHDHNYAPADAIDFPTFILSLASSAQISLGVVPNPITGKTDTNVAHAKQTIDIIGMLDEKTANNLSAEESGLLKQILFQLRMQYVEISKGNNK